MAVKNFGIWQQYTWQDYYERVKYLSLGLISLGLEPGDRVCLIGDNEPEWFWGEFAVQAARGIATGISTRSTISEVKYIAKHSGARLAIANDQEQTDKFLEIKDELPELKRVIYWNPKGLRNYDDPIIISFAEVMELGRRYEETHPSLFEKNIEKGEGENTAFIYYTSGTNGQPKGAVLTHKALIKTAQNFADRYPLSEKDDLISSLSAASAADSFFTTIPHLLTGARLNFAEEPETITEDTREVGPHFIIYEPGQWESMVNDIRTRVTDANPLKRFCYHLFLPVGYKIADYRFAGKKPSLFWRALHQIANLVLFRPLKDRLGLSNVRFAVNYSPVLALDTFRLIHAIGIELGQNYAGTEAGLIASHGKGEIKFETVGRPAVGAEVRESDSGELLVRSEAMFREYYRERKRTREALTSGWFHTGDAVHVNEEGHLIFLDRVENTEELATGARYAPQYIESRLRFSPYIKEAMVIGGKDKDFVSAIINIDFARVGRWAKRNRVPYITLADLSQKKEVAKLVQKDLKGVNYSLPEGARVKKFVLLHKEFDPDEAELIRTGKLRRGFMEERYKSLIDTLYSDKEEVLVESPVIYRDGREGTVTTAIKVRTVEGDLSG